MPSSPLPVTLSIMPRLRAAGVKCRIRHARYVLRDSAVSLTPYSRKVPEYFILPHGGSTTVDLLFPDGGTHTGVANCSKEDRFNRLEGIRIALMRALAARKAWQSGPDDGAVAPAALPSDVEEFPHHLFD